MTCVFIENCGKLTGSLPSMASSQSCISSWDVPCSVTASDLKRTTRYRNHIDWLFGDITSYNLKWICIARQKKYAITISSVFRTFSVRGFRFYQALSKMCTFLITWCQNRSVFLSCLKPFVCRISILTQMFLWDPEIGWITNSIRTRLLGFYTNKDHYSTFRSDFRCWWLDSVRINKKVDSLEQIFP